MTGGDPTRELARALAAEEERLMACVHCGFCLPACPTYVRLGDEADSPRGRLYLMRAVMEGRLAPDSEAFHTHLDRCLGCRACEPVCPSGVSYGHLLERGRAVARAHRSPPVPVRALLAVLARPAVSRPLLALARAARALGLARLGARMVPGRWSLPLAMLAASAPAEITGDSDARTAPGAEGVRSRRNDTARPPVGVLDGCVQAGLFGRVNEATVRTLAFNGLRVVPVAGQGCCGALHAHAGDLEGARELARRNVRAFGSAGVENICVNAAGCGAMMREYGELLADDPLAGEARAVAASVRDVTELLAEAGPRQGGALQVEVAYDPPCHLLHAQGVDEAPLKVLDAIPGLVRKPVSRASECCGGAGVYGMTHPDLGGRIGQDKIDALLASGAAVVATANPGCHMQIGALLMLRGERRGVVHVVELLDESYRRGGGYKAPVSGRQVPQGTDTSKGGA